MRDFWKRRRDRADWPEPRTEFLDSLADEIRETRSQAKIGRFRLALVFGVFVALLLPLAAFGHNTPAGESVKAVVSYIQANTVGAASNADDDDDGGDDDDDGGGGYRGDDDDDGGGDDDDDGGGGGGGGDDDDDGGGGGGGGDDDDDGGGGGGGDDDD
jgi:hypothetical protein